MKTEIKITAIWLRRTSYNTMEVLCEINGKWHRAIKENIDSAFSHIAEGNGAENWPVE